MEPPDRVLPEHPYMIKVIKHLRQSTSAAEGQQLVISSNGPLDQCDFDSSSSSQQSSQSSLLEQLLESINEFKYPEGLVSGISLELGTISSESDIISDLVDTPTQSFSTATTPSDFPDSAQHFLPLFQQQQQEQQQTLRPITQDDINSCLMNQSEMQEAFLLSAEWELFSSGKPVWVTSNDEDQSPGPDGGNRSRRRRCSCSNRKAKAESNKQHEESNLRQRLTHEGCSTIVYNLKKPGVEKPRTYCCDVEGCRKAYKKSSHLRSHQLTHSDEKPHCCQEPGCSMRFRRPDELRKHEKTHLRSKPFQCLDCQELFTRKDHLNNHSARHQRTNGLLLAISLSSP